MYFWKIESLKNDIRSNKLSERDRFNYALIYIVLNALSLELMSYSGYEIGNYWDSFNSISNILIVIVGTIFAFKENGGREGNDFLGRYFSINFVMLIRFMAILMPMIIVWLAAQSLIYADEETISTTYLDTLPFIAWYALFYWRICYHIKGVNTVLIENVDSSNRSIKTKGISKSILKWYGIFSGVSFGIAILFILLIFVVPYLTAPDTLDSEEATALLQYEVDAYRSKPYKEIISLIEKPQLKELTGKSGAWYKLEIYAFWDKEPNEEVRVVGSISDAGKSAYSPMTLDFIMDPSGKFIDECNE